jgi:hypothetical protein
MNEFVIAEINAGVGNQLWLLVSGVKEHEVAALEIFVGGNDLPISPLVMRRAG